VHRQINRVVVARLVDILIDPRKCAAPAVRLSSRMLVPTASITSMTASFQLPGPCFESVRLGRQRTDRAEINDIARKFTRYRAFEVGGDLHILAATNRADFFNAFNHANLNNPDARWGSPTYGQATYGRLDYNNGFPALVPLNETPRQVQIMLKLEF
jgi:hypothetical protein